MVAISPMQVHPVIAGAAVGLDGQLLIPRLKVHSALASFRCRSVGQKQVPSGTPVEVEDTLSLDRRHVLSIHDK